MRTLVWIALSGLLVAGCNKDKKEPEPVNTPPPQGMASSSELSLSIGSARGLPEGLAPSSTKWTRVFVLDDKRAVIVGEVLNEAIALVTDDAGKNFRSIRYNNDRGTWSSFSLGEDGTLVLAYGGRDGARDAKAATLEATNLSFASFDATELTPPMPLFPQQEGPAKGLLQQKSAIAAVLSTDSAALVADEAPRKQAIFYSGRPGSAGVPKLKLPPAEKVIPVALGRPPALLSTRGRDLLIRPFPAAGKPLEAPKKVAGIIATPTLIEELSSAPACEYREWSYQRIKQPGGRLALLGASGSRAVTFSLPKTAVPTTGIGCGSDHIIVETTRLKDPTRPKSTQTANLSDTVKLDLCDLEGHCVTPENAPFRIWPEEHEREIVSAPVGKGVVALMSAHAGEHWGLYLAQSTDGTMYERPRPIGEGTSDRGRVAQGAIVSFGSRVLLLLSADVTGTSRRGWFVVASDDGGTNWNPP